MRKLLFPVLVALFLGTIPAAAQEKYEDRLVKMGLEVGARFGTGYLRGMYGTKIADVAFTRFDSSREREEIRMMFRMWPQYPSGHEKVSLGLDARSYPETGPMAEEESSRRDSRIFFCGSYRVGDHGIIYMDIPLSRVTDGVEWYPRIVGEDIGLRVSRGLYLAADFVADGDPEIGIKCSLSLEWITDSLKLKIGTASSAIAFGTGFNF